MNFRHGQLINSIETGKPIAILTGDPKNNYEPWNIYGRRSWIVAGLKDSWGSYEWGNQEEELENINKPKLDNNIRINNEIDLNNLFNKKGNNDSKYLTSNIIKNLSRCDAALYCRTILTELGPMDLPSIELLMRIYLIRNEIFKEKEWGNGCTFVWSSTEFNKNEALRVTVHGRVGPSRKDARCGVIPALEIQI